MFFEADVGISSVRPKLRNRRHKSVVTAVRRALGFLLTANFIVIWAGPIFFQGWAYKSLLRRFISPAYDLVDKSRTLRSFAYRYVHSRNVYVDYFATAVLFLAGFLILATAVFFWQISFGYLPWWLIVVFCFCWVGIGCRSMGAAYTFAHREGHAAGGRLYRPWIRKYLGNVFENWIGYFYGNVPYNFSTSHVLLHHQLNAGKGDPFYMWDIDRTKFADILLYQWRIFVYMTGWGGFRAFAKQRHMPHMDKAYRKLRKGLILYWFTVPSGIVVLLWATGSTPSAIGLFLFFVYFQPLLAMSSFLAILNIGFHGFIECDVTGEFVPCICANTIIGGEDDWFGENDHMAHHYFGRVSHDRLRDHQASQHSLWARHHASVFRNISILELAIKIHLRQFRNLAEHHYIDFSGEMSVDEISEMLRIRATRKEMNYMDYEFGYLLNLSSTVKQLVGKRRGMSEQRAYIFQASRHHKMLLD